MIDFNNLKITKVPIFKEEKVDNKRFILGVDPFEERDEQHNVFTIFDRFYGRVTTKVRTKLDFSAWVQKTIGEQDIKGMYSISNKFIDGNTGRAKTIDQIRNENKVGVQSLEGSDSALVQE